MRIDVYVHLEPPDSRLDAILDKLNQLDRQEHTIMAGVTDIKALVTALDTETNAVAAKQDAEIAKIAELQAQIAAGSPATAQDLQDIVDGLTPISDRLKALGADTSNPIPPAA